MKGLKLSHHVSTTLLFATYIYMTYYVYIYSMVVYMRFLDSEGLQAEAIEYLDGPWSSSGLFQQAIRYVLYGVAMGA